MAEASAKGARVLIVDDTIQNIQVLGTVLREENYQINVAQNGLQALEVVGKVTPDIILLDVMMPELDGFATCERLKADPATRDIPVIFLTAKVETEDIVRGFELGAVDYVTKPFNATELLARVRTHLEVQRLRRELQQYNEQLEEKVEERTAEVRAAHVVLQRQVRELEGRDRLANVQMTADSASAAHEEVLQVVTGVLQVPRARVYRDDAGVLRAVAAIGYAGDGVIQRQEDLGDIRVEAEVSQVFADGKPRQDGSAAYAPILYGDEPLGVITVDGLSGQGDAEAAATLWRLAREAALVYHTIDMNSDLESGDLDVSALLDVSDE